MPMTAEEITQRILAALPGAEVRLEDLAGDDDHWRVTVKAAEFRGLSRIARHKRVMDAIGPDLGVRLHALSVVTETDAGAPD